MEMTLRMYNMEMKVSICTQTETPCRDYNCGWAVELVGQLVNKADFGRLLKAASEIIAVETDCTAGETPCWCWYCRTGAGGGQADDHMVTYGTGSGHGNYSVYPDGRVHVSGSKRSIETGGEYACIY